MLKIIEGNLVDAIIMDGLALLYKTGKHIDLVE